MDPCRVRPSSLLLLRARRRVGNILLQAGDLGLGQAPSRLFTSIACILVMHHGHWSYCLRCHQKSDYRYRWCSAQVTTVSYVNWHPSHGQLLPLRHPQWDVSSRTQGRFRAPFLPNYRNLQQRPKMSAGRVLKRGSIQLGTVLSAPVCGLQT